MVLENYCDDKYGFLKISIEKNVSEFYLQGEFHSVTNQNEDKIKSKVIDVFGIHLVTDRI